MCSRGKFCDFQDPESGCTAIHVLMDNDLCARQCAGVRVPLRGCGCARRYFNNADKRPQAVSCFYELLRRDPNLNMRDSNGDLPLDHVIRNRNTQIMAVLMKRDVDPTKLNMGSQKWLQTLAGSLGDAATRSNTLTIVGQMYYKTLVESVCKGAAAGDEALVGSMVEDVDINDYNSTGATPMELAAVNGHLSLVQRLLNEWGAAIEQKNKRGSTVSAVLQRMAKADPVVKAHIDLVYNGHMLREHCYLCEESEALALLKGSDTEAIVAVASTKDAGVAAIHIAAMKGLARSVIPRLLELDVDVVSTDSRGMTPIHYAALYGRMEATRTLLASGRVAECLESVDYEGCTPVMRGMYVYFVGEGYAAVRCAAVLCAGGRGTQLLVPGMRKWPAFC